MSDFIALIPHSLSVIYQSLIVFIDAFRSRCNAFMTMGTLHSNTEPAYRDDKEVLAEVERIIADGVFDKSFSKAVQTRFARATVEARFALFFRLAALGILLYDLFVPIDALIVPDVFWLAAVLQFGIGTPISIGVLVAVARFGARSHSLATLTIGTVMMATTITLFLTTRSSHAASSAEAFALITAACNIGVAMPFRWALAMTAVGNAAITGAILLHPALDVQSRVFAIVMNGSVAFLSLAGNYRIEANVRRSFLFALRERLRADSLAVINLQLHDLAVVDGLTGVANRRQFDATLARLWDGTDGRSIALLLIDIDHFKSVNDRFGHQAGDDCLRAVASVLARSSQATGALLARYGGEEFAVLLDAADLDHAMAAAEALRIDVAALRLRLDGEPAAGLTVSIGCASIVPTPAIRSFDLVAAADAALYAAKQGGRNRTVAATSQQLRPMFTAADVPFAGAAASG